MVSYCCEVVKLGYWRSHWQHSEDVVYKWEYMRIEVWFTYVKKGGKLYIAGHSKEPMVAFPQCLTVGRNVVHFTEFLPRSLLSFRGWIWG